MKVTVTFAVAALGLAFVACSTKDASLGKGSAGGGPAGGRSGSGGVLGSSGGSLGSGGGLGSGGSLGSGGVLGSGGATAGAGGSDAGVSPMDAIDAMDAAGSDVAAPACKCGDLCNSCPASAPQCPGAIAYCDPGGACVIGGPPTTCAGGSGGAGGAGGRSCTTVSDCGPNPGAACAQTCPNGSNPCGFVCRSNLCVQAGCPSGAGGNGGAAGQGGGAAFSCGAGGAAGANGSCQGGQTFCHVQNMRSAPATASCQSFTDSARVADCSGDPSCACLCDNALFFHCQTECRCSETAGHVTVTCDPV